jgi:protein-L-isoaspartate O-methyltransferase
MAMAMDETLKKQIASQLARPSGEGGVQITTSMNTTNAFISARALEALDAQPGEQIFEIGPGNGRLSFEMVKTLGPDGNYLAVEYEADIAAIAAETFADLPCPSEVRSGDIMGHAPESQSRDGILAVNVLYFIEDLPAFAEKMHAWLKPGGRIVLGFRSQPAMDALPFVEHGFVSRSLDVVLRTLSRAGFESIRTAYFDEGKTTLGDLVVEVDSVVLSARRP